jgi:hypothetical protein
VLAVSPHGIDVATGEGVLRSPSCSARRQAPAGREVLRGFPCSRQRSSRADVLPALGPPPSRVPRGPARHVAPVAPGIAAWGLMTGVAMVKSGMSVVEATSP